MNDNENKKAPEALADEVLDKVAGGGWEFLWGSASPRVPSCGICHRSEESVAVYTIDFGNGGSSKMDLCPNCVEDLRKKYKVTEGWGGK